MAKKPWKSLWDDYDFDDEVSGSEATKPSGPRPNPDYQPGDADDRDEPQRTIGFHSQYSADNYSADERADTEFGGYGYSGAVYDDDSYLASYRYDSAFDDSDDIWYRRNSFKYSRKTDYSPSSLFRTKFSSRYTYSSAIGSEHTNKAVRALRNLTRSANTIVDKTAAGKKTSFAVHFSSGADVNGLESNLTSDKRPIVYVSPDELMDTTTPDAEDEVIDALTGFVLLRVQMTQDLTDELTAAINATGLHTVPAKLAAQIFEAGGTAKLGLIRTGSIATSVVDEYLAGTLMKAMLIRITRRTIVANWGGFAPYFSRHAKRVTQIREALAAAEASIENVVKQIAYNFIADEEPIELPDEVTKIVDTHLGAELAAELLLPACRMIVHDLRALAAGAEQPPPAGQLESALADILEKIKSERDDSDDKDGDADKFFTALAEQMVRNDRLAEKTTTVCHKEVARLDELRNELRGYKALDQAKDMLEAARKHITPLGDRLRAEPTEVEAQHELRRQASTLSYAVRSRPAARNYLGADGAQAFDELATEGENVAGKLDPTEADARALDDRCGRAIKAIDEGLRDYLRELKNRVVAATARAADATRELRNSCASLRDSLNTAADEIKPGPGVKSVLARRGLEGLGRLATAAETGAKNTARPVELAEHAQQTAARARSLSGLDKAALEARRALNNLEEQIFSGERAINYDFRDEFPELGNMAVEAMHNRELPDETLVPLVARAANNTGTLSDAEFVAGVVDGATDQKLSNLARSENPDHGVAELARHLGVSEDTIRELMRELERVRDRGQEGLLTTPRLDGKELQKLANQASTEASPVDESLFGGAVPAKTKVLGGDAIQSVNEEASNEAEEDYVAYLDDNVARPQVIVKRASAAALESGRRVVNEILRTHRGAVERIRNALHFQSGKRTVETYGLRSGDLDEGGLHKLGYDCEHIWAQKTLTKLPDVAVGILVDQSGSMSGPKIQQAKEMCILLAEAVRKIAGVRLYVYGHTANQRGARDMTIYEHYTPASGSDLGRLGTISACSNNYDGYALKDVAKRLNADPAKRKYLFVIADGMPAGAGYGGDQGAKHVASVCKFVRDRMKIGVHAFAVGVSGHWHAQFKKQYGEKQIVFVDTVARCLPQIVRFLKNTIQQERRLVGVED